MELSEPPCSPDEGWSRSRQAIGRFGSRGPRRIAVASGPVRFWLYP